jgi:hypothetical protein
MLAWPMASVARKPYRCLNEACRARSERRCAEFDDLVQMSRQFPGSWVEGGSFEFPALQSALRAGVAGAHTYCEVGFNMGHSTLLALQTNARLEAHAFDIGATAVPKAAAACLNATFGQRLHVHWGDSRATIPMAPDSLQCDVIFIDGGHVDDVPHADITNLARLAAPGAAVFIDDVFCTHVWCDAPSRAWTRALLDGVVEETSRDADATSSHGFASGRYRIKPACESGSAALHNAAPHLARCLSEQSPPWQYGDEWRQLPQAELQAHYVEVTEATARFRGLDVAVFPDSVAMGAYRGPWIENEWISRFCCSRPLADFGGVLVPLFVQWYDLQMSNSSETGYAWDYPAELLTTLRNVLRRDVLYVTVSMDDCGVDGCFTLNGWDVGALRNVFVLSAGGFGHIPVPLLKREYALQKLPAAADAVYTTTFVGTISGRPAREAVLQVLQQEVGNQTSDAADIYHGKEWVSHLLSARSALVPRGMGRSAYLLYEALQMGVVPTYVYAHGLNRKELEAEPPRAWLPYKAGWASFAYMVPLSDLAGHVRWLRTDEGAADVDAKRRRVKLLRATHFTYDGVMGQIGAWLASSGALSDLSCEPVPTARSERPCRIRIVCESTTTGAIDQIRVDDTARGVVVTSVQREACRATLVNGPIKNKLIRLSVGDRLIAVSGSQVESARHATLLLRVALATKGEFYIVKSC